MNINSCFKRYYTKGYEDNVYAMFKWKQIDIEITHEKTGAVIFSAKNLEFPEQFSINACNIIAKMYFRKAGVPETGNEVSMKQVCSRMINFWADALIDEKIITSDDMRSVFVDELTYMMLSQKWAPNSPQWFNTGLESAYGIGGSKEVGHYYYDVNEKKVMNSANEYKRTQGSACFIVNVEDSLFGDQSITEMLTTSTRLFKHGSGIGANWSKLRAIGEKLASGGTSSGVLSFQKVFDRNAGAIKSGGTTRRAAVMQILDIDHPEVPDFIKWKAGEEKKVHALSKMGYDSSITGEAYNTVSGQNVNNSVSITDAFMERLDMTVDSWELKGRSDSSVNNIISANELWKSIAECAWECGDPGVHYIDTMSKWNTCPNTGKITASNPCSEYLFLNDTACNLASINVYAFLENGNFDYDGFVHAITLIQFALEATIHFGQFPTKEIAYNSHMLRPTGLGLTNMAAMLMSLAIPYDSDEGRLLLGTLCNIMTCQSYRASGLMASTIGAFDEFEKNKAPMLNVLTMHRDALDEAMNKISDLLDALLNIDSSSELREMWTKTLKLGELYGYRNAQTTVLAPTGTIAFAMDCASTSSEPFFSHVVYKKVVDGSYLITVNEVIKEGLLTLGYTEDKIEDIMKYILDGDGKLEGAPHINENDLIVFDTASKCGTGTRYISPEAHVKMVAACTDHLSGGISKTINMPKEATVDDIAMIYKLSWKLGCKCIALYRDGSKMVQPLTAYKDDVSSDDIENLSYEDLLKLTKKLMGVDDDVTCGDSDGTIYFENGDKQITCAECGSTILVKAGTCSYCTKCGRSNGCS